MNTPTQIHIYIYDIHYNTHLIHQVFERDSEL
jgi:hypothetical protein